MNCLLQHWLRKQNLNISPSNKQIHPCDLTFSVILCKKCLARVPLPPSVVWERSPFTLKIWSLPLSHAGLMHNSYLSCFCFQTLPVIRKTTKITHLKNRSSQNTFHLPPCRNFAQTQSHLWNVHFLICLPFCCSFSQTPTMFHNELLQGSVLFELLFFFPFGNGLTDSICNSSIYLYYNELMILSSASSFGVKSDVVSLSLWSGSNKVSFFLSISKLLPFNCNCSLTLKKFELSVAKKRRI